MWHSHPTPVTSRIYIPIEDYFDDFNLFLLSPEKIFKHLGRYLINLKILLSFLDMKAAKHDSVEF